MPSWLKRTLVTLITVLTFGLVTPPASLLENTKADKTAKGVEVSAKGQGLTAEEALKEEPPSLTPAMFVTYAVGEAERQSMLKFGSKIGPVIGDRFKQDILPRMEQTLTGFAGNVPTEDLQHLALSQRPKGGENEKIFHVYDARSGEDLLRFHVRRDHPPKDGYYFDFHYHSNTDGFLAHHELGRIYWNKNQPPQWLS
ncbi:YpjP family protein [Ectobacillus ponti]|uniref:YpjP family protein n=1 Tax=Ectobacillus ponti TaxID=2961894 RepID=A0AA41X4U3_9BACI|nr:YpjP family protein [Ectobacillus ponti]MCP8968946.1 YpjP family protein [Ectobacillus ponti]